MKLRLAFKPSDTKLDWRFSLSIGFALIFPYLILISFLLVVSRLFIGANTGIFSDRFLYEYIIAIISYVILVTSLFVLINYTGIPIIISIIVACILSKMTDFIIGFQVDSFTLNVLTTLLMIILFKIFLKRFKNQIIGLGIGFLLTAITYKIFESIIYEYHKYRQFGEPVVTSYLGQVDILKKFVVIISSGLLFTSLFIIGLLISFRLIKPKNINAL